MMMVVVKYMENLFGIFSEQCVFSEFGIQFEELGFFSPTKGKEKSTRKEDTISSQEESKRENLGPKRLSHVPACYFSLISNNKTSNRP